MNRPPVHYDKNGVPHVRAAELVKSDAFRDYLEMARALADVDAKKPYRTRIINVTAELAAARSVADTPPSREPEEKP